MRIHPLFLVILLLVALCSLLPAQRLIFDVNGTSECRQMTGVRDWFCLATQAPANQPLLVAAIEFPCIVKQGLEFGIWSRSSATAPPGTLLASGKITGKPYPIWQGGPLQLTQPLLIKPGTYFFVGQKNPGGDLSIVKTGQNVSYHYLSGSTWRGPFSSYAWGFRLYSPGGTGKYTVYGKPSISPAAPLVISGMGWPNTGNPAGLLVEGIPSGAQGLLAVGRHHPGINLGGLGTLYVLPIFALSPLAGTAGWASAPVTIPNDPVLAGATFAWQAWFATTSPTALYHTAGLDLLIG